MVLENPGEYPYTRGINPSAGVWTMGQYGGFGTPTETNARFRMLLDQGLTGFSVALDLPTQLGLDSDDPLSLGEVGRVGVAIDSLADIEILMEGIPLEKISQVRTTANSIGYIWAAMFIALAERRGIDPNKFGMFIQNDVLKEYVARGTQIFPAEAGLKLSVDVIEYLTANIPNWVPLAMSGYHIREAGSTAVQELAFTLANGKAYLQAAIDKGLDINVFAKRLSFFFNAHNNLFEEVAKFRAARRMWAKITKDLGATDPRAQMLRFHTQTGGSTLTAQQPQNNIIRVTTQALSAVLGGTQSLHTNGFDEAIALPTEEAARIALRTQQIIAYESGAADTVDPLAGSYFVESLTNEIEAAAWEYINKIDAMGGSVSAIEQGYMQNEIAASSYKYQRDIQTGDKIIVGVNKFNVEEKPLTDIFTVDDSIREKQIQKIYQVKAERDNAKVLEILEKLDGQARADVNLMPIILEAAENYATLGEIADTMRNVFGEFTG